MRLVWRLMTYAVRRRPAVLGVILLGIISSIAEIAAMVSVVPLGILATGGTLEQHSPWRTLPALLGLTPSTKFFVLLFLGLMLFRMLTYIAAAVCSTYVQHTIFAHFAARAHAGFVRHLSFEEIFKHQIGHFFTIAGDESNRGAQIVTGVIRLIPIMLLFTIYAALVFYESWRGGMALVGLGLAVGLMLKGAFRNSARLGRRQQEEGRNTNTHFFDSLGGLRTIRGFNAEGFITNRYREMISQYGRTAFLTESFGQVAQLPFVLIVAILFLLIAIYTTDAGMAANMPLFFAGAMMFTRLMPIAASGLELAMRLTGNLKAGRNIEEMLQAVEMAEQTETLPTFPTDERITRIEFDRLHFRYTPDTPPILLDFSHVMEAGKSYAITGPSGVGKSSLADLLLKFYTPDQGAIRVNGRDITQVATPSLRQHIILAEQATRTFYGTVLENVEFDSKAGHRAEKALAMVGLTELMESLPEGSATKLAFQGNNFSGGQRQRMGLARALVRTADVLILDESTNALDSATRQKILDALLEAYRDRIIIFITHDPYVMERVDEVIEMRLAEHSRSSGASAVA